MYLFVLIIKAAFLVLLSESYGKTTLTITKVLLKLVVSDNKKLWVKQSAGGGGGGGGGSASFHFFSIFEFCRGSVLGKTSRKGNIILIWDNLC